MRIEGLTITGFIERGTQWGTHGRGIRILHGNVMEGIAVVHNCAITDNAYYKGDASSGYGTGLYAAGTVGTEFNVMVTDTLLQGNVAVVRNGNGPGLFISHGRLTIDNCQILDNHARGLPQQDVTDRSAAGGGLYLSNLAEGSVIRWSVIDGNTALAGGGGSYSGAIDVHGNAIRIENCVISGNQGYYVSGIRFNTTSGTNVVRNTLFAGNRAPSWGGDCMCQMAPMCLFRTVPVYTTRVRVAVASAVPAAGT